MKALNVSFSDEEMEQLREAAQRENVSLKALVHKSTMAAVSSRKHQVAQAARAIALKSEELNRRLA